MGFQAVTASSDKSTDEGTIRRISVCGSISGDNLPDIETAITTQMSDVTSGLVILDLQNASYIDSRGISLCIRLFKQCTSSKVKFVLETSAMIYRLLSTTNLTNVIDIRQISTE